MPTAEAFRVAWHVNRKQWFHGMVTLARGAPILLSIPEEPVTEAEALTLECCDARDGCAPGSVQCPCVQHFLAATTEKEGQHVPISFAEHTEPTNQSLDASV